jgi:cytochrome P450
MVFRRGNSSVTNSSSRLYDIAACPGLIDSMRSEIKDTLARHDGILTVKALYEMKLLDSVMKESQRMYPLGVTGFPRVIGDKGITLADGSYLPPKTLISAAADAISHDENVFPNPETYDPFRFYNLRSASTEAAGKHQFVATEPGIYGFGYGRHACPGRFFAANEIKMILANLLLKYDVEQQEKGPRYANLANGHQTSVDSRRMLLFKRVKA